MRIGINCGHTKNGPGCGAVGYLNESNETRNVGYKIMEYLRQAGHDVFDCTNDYSTSTAGNLRNICSLANAQYLDMFLSIHFNSGGGQGCEVFTYGSGDLACAKKMKSALYQLGFKDRGIKDGSHLYVIKHTNALAALLEICFVDSKSDAELYKKIGAEKIAKAIAKAIADVKINTEEVLTMGQYEELKQEIRELTETVKILVTELYNLKNPMVYNYIDENMPEWARASVQKVVDKGILQGDENGLGLTYGDLRQIVWNDRAGFYDVR